MRQGATVGVTVLALASDGGPRLSRGGAGAAVSIAW